MFPWRWSEEPGTERKRSLFLDANASISASKSHISRSEQGEALERRSFPPSLGPRSDANLMKA